jgi:hypothetical protein
VPHLTVNNFQSHIELIYLGEEALDPRPQLFTCFLELVKKGVARLDMIYVSGPSLIHNIGEARHFCPKVLKAKGLGLLRPTIICKKKRAMVGQRQQEGAEDVV